MPYSLFGFLFKNKAKTTQEQPLSFAPPQNDEGAIVIEQGGAFASVVDLDGIVKNEIELITKYREMGQRSEVEGAISEIINESIVTEEEKSPISLVADKLNYSADIKKKITDEFENVLNLMDFNNEGQDIFRRWYIDGRLYFHMVIDPQNPRDGIQEIRYIDPRRIKPVIETESFVSQDGVPMQTEKQRYYVYNQFGTDATTATTGVKIAWDSICYVHSGIQETNNTMILGHLHKALKPSNMLTMIEDASVIYRLCLVGDSKVWTPYGHKEIRDLKAGDLVLSYNQKGDIVTTTVKSQWCNGLKPVVKISSQHHQLTCTPTHPILVMEGNVAKYVDAQDLNTSHELICVGPRLTGEVISMPNARLIHGAVKQGAWSTLLIKGKELLIETTAFQLGLAKNAVRNFLYAYQTLPLCEAEAIVSSMQLPVEIEHTTPRNVSKDCCLPEVVDEDFAELFGFLVGDGWISTSKTGKTVSFAEGVVKETNDRYVGLLNQYFGRCARVDAQKSNYGQYRTYSTYAAEILEALGFEGTAHTKRIPEWVFRSKPEIRDAFMQGFINADGCERYRPGSGSWRCTIKLCNKNLIGDLKELWTSLGYCSGQVHKDITKAHTMANGLYVKECTSYSINLSKLKLPPLEKIQTVEPAGEQSVYDIEIEPSAKQYTEAGVFDLHNFIVSALVSHNSRAPERRIFYIDVGNLPKQKAEQYLKDIMAKYRNKMVYDATTGEIREDKKFLSFMEDYWLPRREGGRGTEISTLPGGENLGEMADIEYFKEKLYQALNVPVSRLKSESTMSFGGQGEAITREEVKFGKFIYRIRNRFTELFDVLLSTQLMLKGIIAKEDWRVIRQKIFYSFLKDTYYSEMKNLEILQSRMGAVERFMPIAGKLISWEWMRRNLLMQTDPEMKQLDSQMLKEKGDPRYQALEAMSSGGMGMPGSFGDMGGMGGGGPEDDGGGAGGEDQGEGDEDEQQGQPAPGPTQAPVPNVGGDDGARSDEEGEGEEEPLDPDDLPTERVTKNVEALWRR